MRRTRWCRAARNTRSLRASERSPRCLAVRTASRSARCTSSELFSAVDAVIIFDLQKKMSVLEKNGALWRASRLAVGGLSSDLVPLCRGVTEDSGLRPLALNSGDHNPEACGFRIFSIAASGTRGSALETTLSRESRAAGARRRGSRRCLGTRRAIPRVTRLVLRARSRDIESDFFFDATVS